MGRTNTAFKVRDRLIVEDSGSTIVDVQGSLGQLFSITDNLEGSLFSVNDISGIPVLEAFSDDTVKIGTFGNPGLTVNGTNATVGNNLIVSNSLFATGDVSGSNFKFSGSGSLDSLSLSKLNQSELKYSVVTDTLTFASGSGNNKHTLVLPQTTGEQFRGVLEIEWLPDGGSVNHQGKLVKRFYIDVRYDDEILIYTIDTSISEYPEVLSVTGRASRTIVIGEPYLTDNPAIKIDVLWNGTSSRNGRFLINFYEDNAQYYVDNYSFSSSYVEHNPDSSLTQYRSFYGSLGINTNTPAKTLTVEGDISGSGTLDITGNTDIGGTLDVTGNTTLEGTLNVTGNTTLNGTLTVDSTGSFKNEISSETYELGFFGSGWRIGKDASAEFENLTVRGTFSVYELLIQQIRATNGSLLISNASKVASASIDSEDQFTGSLFFDTGSSYGHTFRENDIILAQRLNVEGGTLIQSFLQVSGSSDTGSLVYYKLHGTDPQPGFDYVRIGNTVNTDRQGHIYLTADDTNAPYIGVRDGLDAYTDFTTGTGSIEKVRVGKLSGLNSTAFGNLSGYGLWASGSVYLEGAINATTGSIAGWEISSNSIRKEEVIPGSDPEATKVAGMYFPTNDNDIVFKAGTIIGDSTPAFTVRYNGQITGSQVKFTGGKITGSNSSFIIDVDNLVAKGDNVEISGSNFHLLKGDITASNVDLSGKISATSGKIGGFEITEDAITGSNFYLSGSAGESDYFISSSNFQVKGSGEITGSKVLFDGGKIGGFKITSSTGGEFLKNANETFYLRGDATQSSALLISSSNFQVTAGGSITAKDGIFSGSIKAQSGEISGPLNMVTDEGKITVGGEQVIIEPGLPLSSLTVNQTGSDSDIPCSLQDISETFSVNTFDPVSLNGSGYSGTPNNNVILASKIVNNELPIEVDLGIITGSWSANLSQYGLDGYIEVYVKSSDTQYTLYSDFTTRKTYRYDYPLNNPVFDFSIKDLVSLEGDSYVMIEYSYAFSYIPSSVGSYTLEFDFKDSTLTGNNPIIRQYNPSTLIRQDGIFVRSSPDVITRLTGDANLKISQDLASPPLDPVITPTNSNQTGDFPVTITNNSSTDKIYYTSGSNPVDPTPNNGTEYQNSFTIYTTDFDSNNKIKVKARAYTNSSVNKSENFSNVVTKTYTYSPTAPSTEYLQGWNLISLPFNDYIYAPKFRHLFIPDVYEGDNYNDSDFYDNFNINDTIVTQGSIFKFDNKYLSAGGSLDKIETGSAYWVNLQDSITIKWDKALVFYNNITPSLTRQINTTTATVPLSNSWNLIGSLGVPTTVHDPNNIVFSSTTYGFNGSYIDIGSNSLEPGKGYWIATSAEGTINLTPT